MVILKVKQHYMSISLNQNIETI